MPLKTTEPAILKEFEEKSIKKISSEITSLLSEIRIRQSDTQDVAIIDVMKTVSESTLKEQHKLEGMIRQLEIIKSDTQYVSADED